MAAWRYEISLRVLKNISRVRAQRMSEIFFQHEKRNFVSPGGRVMFYLLYEIPNHYFDFNSFLV